MNKLITSKKFFFFLLSIISLNGFLLNGCTTLQTPSSHDLAEKVKASDQWHLEGQLGVQTAQTSGSASLVWTQKNDVYHIHLFGPLGLGSTLLMGNAHTIQLINHDGQIFKANSPEQLLQQELGWSIPVSPLKYWVRGMPAPHIRLKCLYNADHQISELDQLGWNIQYLSYKNNLPQLMQLKNKNAKLKIYVHRWGI